MPNGGEASRIFPAEMENSKRRIENSLPLDSRRARLGDRVRALLTEPRPCKSSEQTNRNRRLFGAGPGSRSLCPGHAASQVVRTPPPLAQIVEIVVVVVEVVVEVAVIGIVIVVENVVIGVVIVIEVVVAVVVVIVVEALVIDIVVHLVPPRHGYLDLWLAWFGMVTLRVQNEWVTLCRS
jgi:hypothetical protein